MNKTVKWLGNYWLTGIALIMFAISICINFTKIEDSNSGLIFGFVGILATFIVVGNYAQVMTIKAESEKEIIELNKIIKGLETSQIEIQKNLTESKGFFHYSMATTFDIKKEYRTAYLAYSKAYQYFSESECSLKISCLEFMESYLTKKQISKEDFNRIKGIKKLENLKKYCNSADIFEIFKKIEIAIEELE